MLQKIISSTLLLGKIDSMLHLFEEFYYLITSFVITYMLGLVVLLSGVPNFLTISC